MEEDELALRFSALAKIMLGHVIAVDAVLKGHIGLVTQFIEADLQALSPEHRASAYGMQLQALRDQLVRLEKSKDT